MTRVAGALVVVVTVAAVALFLREFPEMLGPAALGSAGSVLLAVVLGLSRGPDRSLTGLGASLLVTPAAVTVAGGVVVATVLLVEEIFPVEEEALLSVGWLLIVGNVGIVVGCVLAVFGLALSRRNLVAGNGLEQGMRTTITSGAVLILTALLFLLIAGTTDTTADDAVVAPVADLVRLLGTPVAAVVPARFEVPVVLAALTVTATLFVGRLERWLTATRSHTAGALAGGTITTVAVVAVAGWVYDQVTTELIQRFPEEIEEQMRDATTTTASSFGESTAVLLAVVLCLGVLAGLLVAVYAALWTGLLARERVGSSLAGVGVFLAAVFGATVGAPVWLVLAGVAASLLVWDAGRFGVTLAREVGTGPTRRVEFVHLGAALLVGLAAVGVATLVVGRLPDPNSAATPGETELLALASVVVGLLSLVLSLR